jgi:hypothetical protein
MFLRFIKSSEPNNLGIARIGLGTLADGTPGLELADTNGKLRALFGLGADRNSFLKLTDRNGEAQAVLTAPAEGVPTLQIFDQSTSCVACLPE